MLPQDFLQLLDWSRAYIDAVSVRAIREASRPVADRDRRAAVLAVLGPLYTVFALAVLGRAGYQAVVAGTTGPTAVRIIVPVVLSAVAAAVYLAAAICLRRGTPAALRATRWCCGVELFGVVAVTVAVAAWGGFARSSVWSGLGAGYGFAPLVLPLLGLWACRTAVVGRSAR